MSPEEIAIIVEARELVCRAREGDQNAMGMLVAVRSSAKAGSPRAKAAQAAVNAYQASNPPPAKTVAVGADGEACLQALKFRGPLVARLELFTLPRMGKKARDAGAVVLSQGPALTPPRVSQIAGEIEDETAAQVFWMAFLNPLAAARVVQGAPPTVRQIAATGLLVRDAMKLQRLRDPRSKIADFSPAVGWELGE